MALITLASGNLVKFSILVGLGAIFFDAVIAHGLFWDNDPYWTYWITKSFLITTVFLVGSAWIGIGIWQGLVLTAVHTAILEVYYQWLAPVGLPQEPEWLDFNHLWTTGVPAHYLSILTGYFLALWLWRRNGPNIIATVETRRLTLYALAVTVLVVVLDGIITEAILLRDFPGITFFVQRILIAVVFVAAWTAYAGPPGLLRVGIGSFLLALVWTAYSMYLGPRGLPLKPPTYLGYEDLWWKTFPGAFVSALIGWFVVDRFGTTRLYALTPAVFAVCILIPQTVSAQTLPVEKGTNAMRATAKAEGDGMRVVGPDPVNMKSTQPIKGNISVETYEMGNRWSHVQNTDAMKVVSTFTHGGNRYEVLIEKPMPRHPLGQYTTWSGVVYEHEMHGDTGIGTGKLPKMKPEIALWGWAEVKKNGQVLSPSAPAHVMVSTKGPIPGIMLEINTEDKALLGEPDGHINVMWHHVSSIEMPRTQLQTRSWLGWAGLIITALLFGFLAWRETPAAARRSAG